VANGGRADEDRVAGAANGVDPVKSAAFDSSNRSPVALSI
jgi:hypothetical protein